MKRKTALKKKVKMKVDKYKLLARILESDNITLVNLRGLVKQLNFPKEEERILLEHYKW